jgi:hypothetical protein
MIARALGKSCTMVLLRPPYAGDIHAARANGFLNCIAVIGPSRVEQLDVPAGKPDWTGAGVKGSNEHRKWGLAVHRSSSTLVRDPKPGQLPRGNVRTRARLQLRDRRKAGRKSRS